MKFPYFTEFLHAKTNVLRKGVEHGNFKEILKARMFKFEDESFEQLVKPRVPTIIREIQINFKQISNLFKVFDLSN